MECATQSRFKCEKVLNVYKENIYAIYVSQTEIEEPFPIYNRYQEWSWGAWQTACCYEGEISHRFIYKKNANIDFASWFLITKVLFWILWNFRVFNSICKRTEAKKGNTCTICPERNLSNGLRNNWSCFLWGWWIQQRASWEKESCKHTEKCSQTKGVSSVQSPWNVCCISRKKPSCENWILQVLYSPP